MVRKYLVAARRGLRMTQAELADAIGVTRNTIIKLESGLRVGEGIEGAVEKLLGWELGSLDAIRDGGRPMIAGFGNSGDLYKRERRDEVEEAIWLVKGASEEQKYEAIFTRRIRMAREQQQDGGHQLGQTGG